MKPKTKKIVFAFVGLVIMAGVYGGLIAICNSYLRENELLNYFTKIALVFILYFGLYKIYKWFCRRLDAAAK